MTKLRVFLKQTLGVGYQLAEHGSHGGNGQNLSRVYKAAARIALEKRRMVQILILELTSGV